MRSARILGAAESLLEAIGASLDRAAGDRHERTLEALRRRLSESLLATHLQEGRALSVEQASQEAIGVL